VEAFLFPGRSDPLRIGRPTIESGG